MRPFALYGYWLSQSFQAPESTRYGVTFRRCSGIVPAAAASISVARRTPALFNCNLTASVAAAKYRIIERVPVG